MLVHYGRLILTRRLTTSGAVKKLWNDPAGPKTVFFWAPIFKWALVVANIGDLKRPAEKLSIAQTLSLSTSCVIWCRWSLIVFPKIYLLFAVNFFVATTSMFQLSRIYNYRKSHNLEFLSGEPLATPSGKAQ
jgi:hypothetical protein